MPAVTRPVLPPLQTPKSASFPSEVVNTPVSCASVSAIIKQETSLKTPITPPVAYTDFLKALTPVLASPAAAGALQRSLSDESAGTRTSIISNASTSSTSTNSGKSDTQKSPSSVPPSPYNRRTPTALRRLRIPHSPAFTSSTCGPSPRTALSGLSTGSVLYSPFSPADWTIDSATSAGGPSATRRYFDAPRSACSKPVSVRSVVTRTVTYKRSPPLGPAPKGKKRKLEEAEMPPPPPVAPKDSKDVKPLKDIKESDFPSTLVEHPSDVSTPSSLTTLTPSPPPAPATAVV